MPKHSGLIFLFLLQQLFKLFSFIKKVRRGVLREDPWADGHPEDP